MPTKQSHSKCLRLSFWKPGGHSKLQICHISKSYKCYFFLHMDMFQDEVSVFDSKIATSRGKNGYLSLRHSHMFTFFQCLKPSWPTFFLNIYKYIYTFWDLYIFLFTKSCYLICCNFLYFVLFIFLKKIRYIANITYLPAAASYLILFQILRMFYYFVSLFCLDFLLSWHSINYIYLNTYLKKNIFVFWVIFWIFWIFSIFWILYIKYIYIYFWIF